MGAENAIEYNFQYFYINNDKPGIHKEMQNSDQGISKHFLLTKGQQQHIFPAELGVIPYFLVPSEPDITNDLFYFEGKQADGKPADQNK